jgi:hypothetical protein
MPSATNSLRHQHDCQVVHADYQQKQPPPQNGAIEDCSSSNDQFQSGEDGSPQHSDVDLCGNAKWPSAEQKIVEAEKKEIEGRVDVASDLCKWHRTQQFTAASQFSTQYEAIHSL